MNLLQMVKDAHDACYFECMDCPWCSGRVGIDQDWHDDLCQWPEACKRMGISPYGVWPDHWENEAAVERVAPQGGSRTAPPVFKKQDRFKIGDVVQLRSGGPPGTVTNDAVGPDIVEVAWVAARGLQREKLVVEALRIY